MKTDKYGRRVSLSRDITDTLTDGLPQLHNEEGGQELNDWLIGKEFGSLVDGLVEMVKEHVAYAISLLDITG